MKIIREEVHPKMVKNRQKESALDQTADSSYDYKEDKISPWKSNKDDQTVDSGLKIQQGRPNRWFGLKIQILFK